MNAVDATGALVPRERTMRRVRSGDRSAVVAPDPARAPTETSSKYWGVSWNKSARRWKARYEDADGKTRHIGLYDTQEAAAHAVNAAIRRAGLEGKRHMNAVDATGALVPRERKYGGDRSAIVAPDPARAPTAPTSKFWGVHWDKKKRRWQAGYGDANGKRRHIGYFATQEEAAHAVNAAIRRAGLEGKRRTNPVVDGQLVPRAWKKRRREESGAANAPAHARTGGLE
jgi:hypothetical protein